MLSVTLLGVHALIGKKQNIMTEQLLKMAIGETKQFPRDQYDALISTKSRLKRQGKGEWQSELSSHGFYIKRTA